MVEHRWTIPCQLDPDEAEGIDGIVTEAIDFSRFLDAADRYRDRGRYRAAATIYRALFEGIEQNMDRFDAAYDHYLETFQTARGRYVECVRVAGLSDDEYRARVDVTLV
jgi:uncharacterized Zn finger protein